MLSHHLQSACQNLQDLIEITNKDIEDIKEASHNAQFDRREIKEEKLKSFENNKAMIDYEIAKLMSQHPQKDLVELLSTEESTNLKNMKSALSELRDVNNRYAKMVLSVSTFYNSLLERVIPTEMDGYRSKATQNSSFLKVSV
jgi:D-mannonate dehydratase